MPFTPTVELIMGPMYSGKSSELLSRAKRMLSVIHDKSKIVVINSSIDSRCGIDKMKTHDNSEMDAIKVTRLYELRENKDFINSEIVLIDESQFFEDLYDFVVEYVASGKSFIISGLNGDAKQAKFGDIIRLIPMADKVIHKTALCMICCDGHTPAPFTIMRKTDVINDDTSQIHVGASETYLSVCRACINKK